MGKISNRDSFFVGTLFGFGMCSMLVILIIINEIEVPKAIQACEAELPRNRHCVLIAVPKEQGHE